LHISNKYLYIIAFYMSMMGHVTAQNADTLYYRSQSVRSVGVGFPAINYSLLSPLNHSGYSLNFHSTRFLDKPEYLNQFRMHFELGLLYNYANDSYITTLGFNGGWSRHRYTGDRTRPLRLLLGLGADAGLNIYMKEDNTNNPLAYFFNLSVSPDMLVKYRWANSRKTRFEVGQQIFFPVASLISSSEYSSTLPYGFTEEEASFFEAMRFVTFDSFRKFVTITTLDITPSMEQRKKWPVFRISYMFTGMTYSNGDFAIKSADHVVLFGAIFHLFR